MVQVTEEVKGQNTIVIPSDLKSIYTTFLFSSVDGNAEITINAEDGNTKSCVPIFVI